LATRGFTRWTSRAGASDALPKAAFSSGRKYVYDNDLETPNTQIATLDYGDAELVFEVRGLNTGGEYNLHGTSQGFVGNIFYGKKGFMSVDHVGFEIFLGDKFPQGGEEPQAHGP
jgi:hypothetical protein